MQVSETRQNDALIISPVGRLDSNTSSELDKQLQERMAGQTKVVLDMAGLDYVSSAGLRILLMAAKKMKQNQGKLVLCGLLPAIKEVFEISGFLNILTVRGTLEDALAELA